MSIDPNIMVTTLNKCGERRRKRQERYYVNGQSYFTLLFSDLN
jgi:hypothetical protein